MYSMRILLHSLMLSIVLWDLAACSEKHIYNLLVLDFYHNMIQVYHTFKRPAAAPTTDDSRGSWDFFEKTEKGKGKMFLGFCVELKCLLFSQPPDHLKILDFPCEFPCSEIAEGIGAETIATCLKKHAKYGNGYMYVGEFGNPLCTGSPPMLEGAGVQIGDSDLARPGDTPPPPPPLIVCLYSRGTVVGMPVAVVCGVEERVWRESHDVESECGVSAQVVWEKRIIDAHGACAGEPEVVERKILWISAKMNYFLTATDILLIIVLLLRHIYKGKRKQKLFMLAFISMNLVWMVWRVQETLNWDNRWRSDSPYMCIFTNYIRYTVEGGALYTFAITSIHRLQAVSRPLQWHTQPVPRLVNAAAVIVGLLVGVLVSTLNLVALLSTGESQVTKTCTITHDTANIPMYFILVVKVLNLSAMFVLPFLVIMVANTVMFVLLQMARRRAPRKKKISKSKVSSSWAFLCLSSLIGAFFLAKPASELKMAERMYRAGEVPTWSRADVIAEGVLWNLTTLAMIVITLAGIKFSPQGSSFRA